MTDRWKVRLVREPGMGEYVGHKGELTDHDGAKIPRNKVYGDSIADVFNSIASRESEQP